MYVDQIIRNLQELEELLRLIDKSSPEVPDILYKLAVEKAEAATENVKSLPFMDPRIPEDRMSLEKSDEDVIDIYIPGEVECEIGDNSETQATRLDEVNPHEDESGFAEDISAMEQNPVDFVVKGGLEESYPELRTQNAADNKKIFKDIRKLMSLNDKFRFKRELFFNSDEVMNNTLDALNEFLTFEESVAFLQDQFGWDVDTNEPAVEFLNIVEKRFL